MSNLGLQPRVSRLQGKISLEGYTPAKMAAGAAAPKAHAILQQRQSRGKVAQVRPRCGAEECFSVAAILFKGLSWFSFLGDTGFSDDQKQDENRVFAYFRPTLHLYFLLPHDPTHFAAKPYTVKGFV